MASVLDVAKYILDKTGEIPALKLQKLVYYSQAWSLVWDDAPLFDEEIQAWANGPVAPRLYREHRLMYSVTSKNILGNAEMLTKTEKETVDAVLKAYGDKSSHWLSDLTHMEDPWKDAREGIPEGERAHTTITNAAMAEYYSSL